MAVTYIGVGSYAAGNNASVTPGLPAGITDGDLLVLYVAIRQDAATANTPSGWTDSGIGGYYSPLNTTEHYLRIFYRFYATGQTAPTVAFTGGTTKATTQAVIQAYRGVRPSNPITPMGGSVVIQGTSASTYAGFNFYDSTYQVGDILGLYGGGTNNAAQGTSLTQTYINGVLNTVANTTYFNASSLGNSACLDIITSVASQVYDTTVSPNRYQTVWYAPAAGALAGTCTPFIIHGSAVFVGTGSGGSIVGGSASVNIHRSNLYMTTSGGSKVGGGATAKYQVGTLIVSGNAAMVMDGRASANVHHVTEHGIGSGGIRMAGIASANLATHRRFYIDPFNGNDANAGTSWASAWKTFYPVEDRVITPAAGDYIKIAKTPDPVATVYSFTNHPLSGGSQASVAADFIRAGRNVMSYIAVPLLNTSIAVIVDISGNTGWVAGPTGASIAGTYSTYGSYKKSPLVVSTSAVTDTTGILWYHTTAANLNLSAFSRIEIPVEVCQPGTGVTGRVPNMILSLCSDAVGAVSLLDIPFNPYGNAGGVFAYNGALPSGINSISFRRAGTALISLTMRINTPIATLPYPNTGYYGYLTHYRFGSHEGAIWHAPSTYTGVTPNVQLGIAELSLGKAADYGISAVLWTRTVASWQVCGFIDPVTNSNDGTQANNYNYDAAHLRDRGTRSLFNLTDIQGSSSDPFVIEGGYDPATDQINGTSYLISTYQALVGDANYPKASPLAFAQSSRITIRNIGFYTEGYGYIQLYGSTSFIRFEDCSFGVMWAVSMASYGTGVIITPYYGTPTSTLTFSDIYLLRCYGYCFFYLAGAHPYTTAQLEMVKRHTYNNCVITPMAPYTEYAGIGNNAFCDWPITLEGSYLKLYYNPDYMHLSSRHPNRWLIRPGRQLPHVLHASAALCRRQRVVLSEHDGTLCKSCLRRGPCVHHRPVDHIEIQYDAVH